MSVPTYPAPSLPDFTGDDRGPETFLFTWNPTKWEWTELSDEVRTVEKTGRLEGQWSCGRSKRIQPGDRFFLLKQGSALPRGILGSGTVTTPSYAAEHWSGADQRARYVDLVFDVLLDPGHHELLDRSRLDEPPLDQVHWSTQSSGIRIPADVATHLEDRWQEHLEGIGYRVPDHGTEERASAEWAEHRLRRIVRDPEKWEGLLAAFADAIERVHGAHPELWSITLLPDRCRLILAQGIVCTLQQDSLWMHLARDGMAPSDRRLLDRSETWRWDDSAAALASRDDLLSGYFTPGDEDTCSVVNSQNDRAIDILARRGKVLRTMSRNVHAPGVLAFLRTELRRPLPDPAWTAAS